MAKRIARVGLAALAFQAVALAESPNPDMLGPEQWPTTVEATVKDILSSMPKDEKAKIKSTRKDDLIRYHHGWGTGIRNYYGLRRGNKDLIRAACGRPCDPDEASMKIIEAVWEKLQNVQPGR